MFVDREGRDTPHILFDLLDRQSQCCHVSGSKYGRQVLEAPLLEFANVGDWHISTCRRRRPADKLQQRATVAESWTEIRGIGVVCALLGDLDYHAANLNLENSRSNLSCFLCRATRNLGNAPWMTTIWEATPWLREHPRRHQDSVLMA